LSASLSCCIVLILSVEMKVYFFQQVTIVCDFVVNLGKLFAKYSDLQSSDN
jgi:hypothetical protein